MPMQRLILPCILLSLALLAEPAPADDERPEEPKEAVAGLKQFPGDAAQKARLLRDGFLVLPRYHKQIFSPYIGGRLPYYITTDSAQWTWQVLLEATIKDVEYGQARALKEQMAALRQALERLDPAFVSLQAEAVALARAHVAVAARLLGLPAVEGAKEPASVTAEVALITAARGSAPSPLHRRAEDYGAYLPRGLYAGIPVLEAYFRAATWLSRMGLSIEHENETWAALAIVRAVASSASLRHSLSAQASLLDGRNP